MDELKKYLTSNIDLLNTDVPSIKVWHNIKQEVKPFKKHTIKIAAIVKYVAAACIITLAGIGIFYLSQTKKTEILTTINQPQSLAINQDSNLATEQIVDTPVSIINKAASRIANAVFSDTQTLANAVTNLINPSKENNFIILKDIDSQFSYVINQQKNIIKNIPIYTESPSFFNDFITSYKRMENDELTVKRDIESMGFTNDLLEQIININQQKLNLLKVLQIEISKTNFRFKQNRNLIDTTKVFYIEI